MPQPERPIEEFFPNFLVAEPQARERLAAAMVDWVPLLDAGAGPGLALGEERRTLPRGSSGS